MVAVGDSAGTLHILDVPWTLSYASTNEVGVARPASLLVTLCLAIPSLLTEMLSLAIPSCTLCAPHTVLGLLPPSIAGGHNGGIL